GGEAGARSPLRFGAAASGASIGRRARRLIGALTAPPPPRCAIRPRARAARLSPAGREQAGDGLSSLHVPRRDEARDEWDVACAALDLRRLRVLGVAAAQLARGPPAGGARGPAHGAARERGRRRSAYEAPHGSVAPGPASSGAESKRRRCPRSRARTSRVTLLDQDLQRVEPEAGLVELAAELRPPGAGRVERRVLDAVNVGGEL